MTNEIRIMLQLLTIILLIANFILLGISLHRDKKINSPKQEIEHLFIITPKNANFRGVQCVAMENTLNRNSPKSVSFIVMNCETEFDVHKVC